MLKRILTGAMAVMMVGTSGTVGYAIGTGTELKTKDEIRQIMDEENIVKIISLEDDLITSENTILLSGKAKEGSQIIIDVYSLINIEQTDFSTGMISDIQQEQEIKERYKQVYSKEITIGELGIFAEELGLNEGKNKIAISLLRDGEVVSISMKYVTVTNVEDAKEELKEIKDINLLEVMKKVVNSVEEIDTSK